MSRGLARVYVTMLFMALLEGFDLDYFYFCLVTGRLIREWKLCSKLGFKDYREFVSFLEDILLPDCKEMYGDWREEDVRGFIEKNRNLYDERIAGVIKRYLKEVAPNQYERFFRGWKYFEEKRARIWRRV